MDTPPVPDTPFQRLKRGESLTCTIGLTLTYGTGVTQTYFEAIEGVEKSKRQEGRRGNGGRRWGGMAKKHSKRANPHK
jgi:hypothetical protein